MSSGASSPTAHADASSSSSSSHAAAASSSSSSNDLVGYCWALLGTSMTDGQVLDDWMADINEHYIMKSDLQICTGDDMSEPKNRTVVLTEESYIEMKLDTPCDPPALPAPTSPAIVQPTREKKHKSLLEIHSVDLHTSKKAFRINFFSGSASAKAKAGLSKMKRLLGSSSNFEDFLKSKLIRCRSEEETSQWILVLDKLMRNAWQQKLEELLIPSPEIFKRHAFVIKQHNDRLILLTDMWFYNIDVEYKPMLISGIKWAIPVSSFTSVTQSKQQNKDDTNNVMTISFDEAEAKKQWDSHHRSNKTSELKNKHHEFTFRTREERQRFVNSLAAVYWQVTRKKLAQSEK